MPALRDERLESDEPLVVWQWRFEQAAELGASVRAAVAFADGDGDLARLRELVGRGCDPELAARIA